VALEVEQLGTQVVEQEHQDKEMLVVTEAVQDIHKMQQVVEVAHQQ
jgi:hypothetical protein